MSMKLLSIRPLYILFLYLLVMYLSIQLVWPHDWHLYSCIAKQHINPKGKKQIPQQIPQHVNSFDINPVWHL